MKFIITHSPSVIYDDSSLPEGAFEAAFAFIESNIICQPDRRYGYAEILGQSPQIYTKYNLFIEFCASAQKLAIWGAAPNI